MSTEFYVRKPLVVEAAQVLDDNVYDLAKWCGGEVKIIDGRRCIEVNILHHINQSMTIAKPGMWILRSTRGFKVYGDKPFQHGFVKADVLGNDLTEEVRNGLEKIAATSVTKET